MTINISEIKYEETFVGLYGDFTHYFIAPKELVEDNYPDCEHATISIERDGWGGYINTICHNRRKENEYG